MTTRFAWLAVLIFFAGSARADQSEDLRQAVHDFESGAYRRAADLAAELLGGSLAPADRALAQTLLLRSSWALGDTATADRVDSELAQNTTEAAQEILHARSEYAFDRGRRDDSEQFARAALAQDPADAHARFLLARALMEKGARAEARDLAKLDGLEGGDLPQDSDRLLDMGRLLGAVGSLEAAARCGVYAEQARKNEKRPTTEALLLLGDLYRQARSMNGDEPRAFSTYREALQQNPNLVSAKVGRALLDLYIWETDAGEKEIDGALAINPNSVEALTAKAWLRVVDGRYRDAIAQLDKALEVNPAAKRARATRAAALYLRGDRAAFDAEVARVLELDPTWGELYQIIGDALSIHVRLAEAVPFQKKAVELDPSLGMAFVSLGRDLCFAGDEKSGREALEHSLEIDPFPHPWRANILVVLDTLDRDFVDSVSDHYRFRLHVDEKPILGPRLEQAFESDRVRLQKKYGWLPAGKVLVEAFPVHEDFSVRSVGFMGLGALGVCFGDLVTLLSPRAMRGQFVWRRTALHEQTHVFTLGRSKSRIPRWLGEGLSVFEERDAVAGWNRDQEGDLYQAYWNGQIIPLREFNAAFRGPRILFAYYQGGLWAEFVVARYGFDKILAMLDAYATDLEDSDVIQKVFAKSPEDMDAEFRDYLFETRLKNLKMQVFWSSEKRGQFRERLRKNPNDVEAMAELAQAHRQTGNAVDCDVLLEKVLKKDPTNVSALRLAARRSLDRGRTDLAKQHIETAFANGGQEYFAAMDLAKIDTDAKDFAGAKRALEIAIECYPHEVGSGSPYLALAQILAADDAAAATEVLRRYVALDENTIKYRVEVATWDAAHGKSDEALALLREAEDIDPFIRDVYRRQADACRALNKPGDAITALRSALLVDPRLAPSYTPRPGPEEQEQKDAAREKDEQERADILVEIAELELAADDRAAATRDLDAALSLRPGHERAQQLRQTLNR